MSLKSFIRFHDSRIPPLSGTPNNSNSNILLSHATLYGSSAILHSHFARKNAKARREMLRCAQKLVEICKQLQGHRDLRVIQSSLVPMVSSSLLLPGWHPLTETDTPQVPYDECHSNPRSRTTKICCARERSSFNRILPFY
ncbi:hypothetical protein DL93DRAFT_2084081 [Clavulina sp. PMI_390]|nr:hypothetical protein DL93DRAFT_2084081 [Clavulina sp. PMI_390]